MSQKVTTSPVFFFSIVYLVVSALALGNGTADDREVRAMIEDDDNLVPTSISQNEDQVEEASEPDFQQRKWVSQLFLEAQSQFHMDANVNDKCKRDFELYSTHLQNQSVWAVRMLESSQWPLFGVFGGTVDHFGSYDECLWISSHGINGQYCLAEATYGFAVKEQSDAPKPIVTDHADEEDSVWKAIDMYLENPVRIDRHEVRWALCIPASCKNTELNMSLNNQLQPLFHKHGLNISVNVDPIFCKQKEKPNFSPGYYIVSVLYGVIFSLVISSSAYDVIMRKSLKKAKHETALIETFRSFSVIKNCKKLVKYNSSTDVIGINVIKVINIILVIYGHRFIYFIGFPKFHSEGIEGKYRLSSIELIHTNVVDVFFMVSGFLVFFFGFLPMKKGGSIYLVLSIVFRWIRMVPVFGLLILFIINIMPYINQGPLWDFRIQNEVQNCQASWWANLLAVNNIVKTDQQCLLVSWYISTDIQLTVIGSILLLLVCRNRKFGCFVTVMTFIAAAGVTFTVAYLNGFHGLLRLYISLLEEPRNNPEFTNFYVATYTRVGPYLIGFLSAFVAHVLKEKNYTFTTKQMLAYSILSILIGEGSQYYGCLFYLFGRSYYPVESAIYAAINRSLFTLPYGVVLCIYFTSGLSIIGKLMECRIFLPLGRLTYSVFLVNTLIQLIHASSQKSIMPTSTTINLFWWAASDVMFSYALGFFLYLFAESPVTNMSKILQRRLISISMKSRRNRDNVDKIESASSDATSDKSNQYGDNKNNASKDKNEQPNKNGYFNQSFVTSESMPKISESSRF